MDTSSEQLISEQGGQIDPKVEAIQIESETETVAKDQLSAHSSEVAIAATSASEETQESTKDGQVLDAAGSAVIDLQPEQQEPVPQNDVQLPESKESPSTTPSELSLNAESPCMLCCVEPYCGQYDTQKRTRKANRVFPLNLVLLALSALAVFTGLNWRVKCPVFPAVGALTLMKGFLGCTLAAAKIIVPLREYWTKSRNVFSDVLEVTLLVFIFTVLTTEVGLLFRVSPESDPTSSNYCDPVFYHSAVCSSVFIAFVLLLTMTLINSCYYTHADVPRPPVINNGVLQDITAIQSDV